jgi:YVTN family beta-propeller protein
MTMTFGTRGTRWRAAAVAAVVAAGPAGAGELAGDAARVVRDGVVVDFALRRPGAGPGTGTPLRAGEQAEVRFSIADAATGKPVTGLSPAAWLDVGSGLGGRAGELRECKDKIALYLKGIVGIRPLVDLNSYYLLVLNQDPSISVIDPVVSMTGVTSLYAKVILKRPGADWARSRDARRLFVSMPRAGEVAVVDTETFKVERSLPAGKAPTRVALQPDGRLLWVGDDAEQGGGVVVIDAQSLEVKGRVATGKGHHEIAFSVDGRTAFVTNRGSGTVSAVDVATLSKVKDLVTGPVPISIGTSSLSQAVYVADGKAGTVAAIDPARLEVVARIASRPGLGPMRFSEDGRHGLVVNPAEQALVVLDASENRIIHTIPMEGQPYQVAVTAAFAYVRLLDSPQVRMVNLGSLGPERKPTVQSFGAGTAAPRLSGELSLADAVTPASTEAAVFVVNPSDGNSYFYMEGMNAPSGSFGSYGHQARAVSVVDRSLKEVEPGVYAGALRLPVSGRYDVAFLLDSPRVLHCFTSDVAENPALKQGGALAVEYLEAPSRAVAGQEVTLRFRLSDPASGAPQAGLRDVLVTSYGVPGRNRTVRHAVDLGDGRYEVRVAVERAGAWYLFLAVPSLGVEPNQLPFRTLDVAAPGGAAPRAERERS